MVYWFFDYSYEFEYSWLITLLTSIVSNAKVSQQGKPFPIDSFEGDLVFHILKEYSNGCFEYIPVATSALQSRNIEISSIIYC